MDYNRQIKLPLFQSKDQSIMTHRAGLVSSISVGLFVLSGCISKDDLKKNTNAALITEGKKTFEAKDCAQCHGKQATGTTKGPNLTTGSWQHSDGSLEGLTKTITNGVSRNKLKNKQFPLEMSPASKYLSKKQIAAVAAYIHSLNKKD